MDVVQFKPYVFETLLYVFEVDPNGSKIKYDYSITIREKDLLLHKGMSYVFSVSPSILDSVDKFLIQREFYP